MELDIDDVFFVMRAPLPSPALALRAGLVRVPLDRGGPVDGLLRGGLRAGSLTEVAGPPGACKTALGLQAALGAANDQGMAVVYVNTENRTSLMRRMARVFADAGATDAMERVTVAQVDMDGNDAATQLHRTLSDVHVLIRTHARSAALPPVRLVVVDSVAMALSDADGDERTQTHHRVADILHQIASDTVAPPAAVLVMNHVADAPSSAALHASASLRAAVAAKCGNARFRGFRADATRCVVPALGLFWAQCVHARLFLRQCRDDQDDDEPKPQWELAVAYAPHLPSDAAVRFRPREVSLRA